MRAKSQHKTKNECKGQRNRDTDDCPQLPRATSGLLDLAVLWGFFLYILVCNNRRIESSFRARVDDGLRLFLSIRRQYLLTSMPAPPLEVASAHSTHYEPIPIFDMPR